jgi:dihydrolipoamide dehydrogenase
LVAVGRVPNSDTLGLERTGVRVNKEDGLIDVDEYLETSASGIFALGDAVGRYPYKHNANLEAQYAFNNIMHPERKIPVNYAAMPHAIFSSPQVASVGYTEQELKKNGINYAKSVYPYIDTAMGQAIDDREGFVKFLVHKDDGKILGCHILGTDASVLIHEVLVSMRAGSGTINDIRKTVHIHPALSEAVSRAAGAIG